MIYIKICSERLIQTLHGIIVDTHPWWTVIDVRGHMLIQDHHCSYKVINLKKTRHFSYKRVTSHIKSSISNKLIISHIKSSISHKLIISHTRPSFLIQTHDCLHKVVNAHTKQSPSTCSRWLIECMTQTHVLAHSVSNSLLSCAQADTWDRQTHTKTDVDADRDRRHVPICLDDWHVVSLHNLHELLPHIISTAHGSAVHVVLLRPI